MGLKVLSGHFNLSCLGPFPKVTSAPSPLDKGLQKGPEQTHSGSAAGMGGTHLKTVRG